MFSGLPVGVESTPMKIACCPFIATLASKLRELSSTVAMSRMRTSAPSLAFTTMSRNCSTSVRPVSAVTLEMTKTPLVWPGADW